MDPRTVISCSLILCFFVDFVCLSSGDEKILTNSTLELIVGSGVDSPRHRRVARDEDDDPEDDVKGAPPDHVIPFSSHENPKEPSTKPKYTKPGDWAKPPPDRTDIPLDFVPTKLYAQVRGTRTVKRAPRAEAIASATTPEEILAAPRLREVVSNTKKNTVYTEEGYEDSAYDHAGHARDADFHEGFARKLDDKLKTQKDEGKNSKVKKKNYEDDDDDDEELSDYDDDYREHVEESSRVEDAEPLKKGGKKADIEKYRKIKGVLQDPEINPKKVTENEIERLEEDLEREYAESERNVENGVPENLRDSGSDSEDEESSYEEEEEEDTSDRDYGKRMEKAIAGSREASREFLKNRGDDKSESRIFVNPTGFTTLPNPTGFTSSENPTGFTSSENPTGFTTSKNPTGFTSSENPKKFQQISTTSENSAESKKESPSTPNYGQLFHNYFKLVGDKWKTQASSTTPSEVSTTATEAASIVPEKVTSLASPQSPIHSTLRNFEALQFGPLASSSTIVDFDSAASSSSPIYPRASSLYESWKRRDRGSPTDEIPEFGNLEAASSSYPMEFARLEDSETNHNDATTSAAPKKIYTVIIRSTERSAPPDPPCSRRDAGDRSVNANSIAQHQPTTSFGMLKRLKDQVDPREINAYAERQPQEFTVVRPASRSPPLRQVAHADFSTDLKGDTYHASPVRQSVKQRQESGRSLKKVTAPGRDRYNRLTESSPHDKRFSNLFGHASSEAPTTHFRHRHGRRGRDRPSSSSSIGERTDYPSTRLRPPSPAMRSKYADFLAGDRQRTRYDRSSQAEDAWSDLFGLYRSIDRTIFGLRRRRSVGRGEKIGESSDAATSNDRRGKVNYRDASVAKNSPTERNLARRTANRLVPEKSVKRHEELLDASPSIAEKEINAEIEARFGDEVEDAEDDDRSAKIGKIEVPEFDVAEVIGNEKNAQTISVRPSESTKLNAKKYPFYGNDRVPEASALRYITDPRQVPRKTLGGTEFYDSRDRYRECDEVEPNLERVAPEPEEPVPGRSPGGDEPRLQGLGNKLDCFRAKYFDDDPLDNPLFLEQSVDEPRAPPIFDPTKFASRIFDIRTDDLEEPAVAPRRSRKPEVVDLRRSGSNQVAREDEKKSAGENRQSAKGRGSRRNRPERRGRTRKPVPTTTEPPQELPVTPYQRQVYEDVMGTIKNLAGMYRTFGESAPTQSTIPIVNHLSDSGKNRYPVVHITERPRGGHLIHGLLPPRTTLESEPVTRYRVVPYRTNKVTYRMRARTEVPPGGEGPKLGYFKTVRVHKRSVDPEESDMIVEETRNIASRKNVTDSGDEKAAGSERVVYTIRDRIRYSKPRADLRKIGKFSNLEAAGTEDVRRHEPRYNGTKRRKVAPTSTVSSAVVSEEPIEEAASTATAVIEPDRTKGRKDFHEEPGEIYKIQFSTAQGTQAVPAADRRRDDEDSADDDEEDFEEETESEESRKEKPRNNYDVRENVEDDVTTVPTLSVEPTRSSAFEKIEEYLRSDPPGYEETFETTTEPSSRYKTKKNEEAEDEDEEVEEDDEERPRKSYQRAETRREDDEEEQQDEDDRPTRPTEGYADEESSPRSEEADDGPDSPSESYVNPEDDDEETKDEETKEEETHDGEKEFHRFASRPYSPFESYDDPKYSDLGPRLSKPAFNHPTFEKPTSKKNRRGEHSEESEDDGSEERSREKTSRYVFPWEEDDDEAEGVEESRAAGSLIGRYEYPWERRERLAKERRKKEKARREYEKLFGYSDDLEEDEDDEEQRPSSSKLTRRRVYPWKSQLPTKKRRGKKPDLDKVIDNVEVGTEYRPVTKFSSRYKSRMFSLRDDDDPIVVSGADPSEIRFSVVESLKRATQPAAVDPVEVLKNIVRTNVSSAAAGNATDGVKSVFRVPGTSTTVAPRRSRTWKTTSVTLTSTVAPSTTTTTSRPVRTGGRLRPWRVATTTTKRPLRSRKKIVRPTGNDLLKTGTLKKEVVTDPPTSNDSLTVGQEPTTTMASMVTGKIRRRGKSNRPRTTTTTSRPLRRRLTKSTPAPKAEEATVKMATERTTTPKSKTVEHRSSFSKEEIITKTSYPRSDDDRDKDEGNGSSGSKNDPKESKKANKMNESVKKVSIVTKKTPDHIYRTEEVDKDGVKGMFVSIMPNNATNSSMDLMEKMEKMENMDDRGITDEDTKEMLKSFEKNEPDTGSSFAQDSHLMANLLRQVAPFMNDLTFDESFQGGEDNFLDHGSGDGEDDQDNQKIVPEPGFKIEKDPNNRLYYYVDK